MSEGDCASSDVPMDDFKENSDAGSVASSSSASASASPPRRVKRSEQEILTHTELLDWDGPDFPAPAVLPTRLWWPLPQQLQSYRCLRVTIQHGLLEPLEVRVLYGSWEPAKAAELEELLRWLCDEGQGRDGAATRRLLGMDAESGKTGVRWVQLSTATRCVLLQLPKQTATPKPPSAHAHSTSAVAASPPFLLAPLRRLLADRLWFKSGAELWTDALELFGACDGMITDGCLDVSVSHCAPNGDSISLLDMCDKVVGEDAFRKDRWSSCSNWDAETLTLRQLIYAALDAQSSYALAAFSEDKGIPLPAPIHLSRLPRSWLLLASNWRRLQRLEEVENREPLEVAYHSVTISSQLQVTVRMKAFPSRARLQSNVTFHWKDGTHNEMQVLRVQGKTAQMQYKGGGDKMSQSREPEDIEKIELHRGNEDDIFRKPAQKYFSAFMHGREAPSPFVNALLQLQPPASSDAEPSECAWWSRPITANSDHKQLKCFQSLNASQQGAIELTDSQRITIVQGPPGTGKTRTIAVEAYRSSHRLSSIDGANKEEEERATRVLCVAETNTAARHMAESIVKLGVSPSDLQLVVSNEFECEWHNELYDELVRGGYMAELAEQRNKATKQAIWPVTERPADASKRCRILVATIGKVFGASQSNCDRFQHRPTLIVDEASQVHDLKALLLLRRLTHTERLLLFGDERQLAPYVARQEANSVLDAAAAVVVAPVQQSDSGFRVSRTMLDTQYRMRPHLGGMISQLFYQGKLKSHKEEPDACVEFEHVDGKVKMDGTSSSNPSEARRVSQRWRQFTREGYEPHDIVVLCFYEAQRKYISGSYPDIRCYNVDSFQGQEAPVILLTLCTSRAGDFLSDPRRVNVACSRAQEKLVIFGHKKLLHKSGTVWNRISAFLPPLAKPDGDSDCADDDAGDGSAAAACSSPPSAQVAQAQTSSAAAAPSSVHRALVTMSQILCDSRPQLDLADVGAEFKLRFGQPFNVLKLGTMLSFLRSHPADFRLHEPATPDKQWSVSSNNDTPILPASASATQPQQPATNTAATSPPQFSPAAHIAAAANQSPPSAQAIKVAARADQAEAAILIAVGRLLRGRGPELLSWLGAQPGVRRATTSRSGFSWKPFIERHPTLLRHSHDATKQTLVEWIGEANSAPPASAAALRPPPPVDCLGVLRRVLHGRGPTLLAWIGERPAVASAEFKRAAGCTLWQFVETHSQQMRLTRDAKKHPLVEWIEVSQTEPAVSSSPARPASTKLPPAQGHWSAEQLRVALQQLLQFDFDAVTVPLESLALRFRSSHGRSVRECSGMKLAAILKKNPSVFAVTTKGDSALVSLCSSGAASSSGSSSSSSAARTLSSTVDVDKCAEQLASLRLQSPQRSAVAAAAAAPAPRRAPSAPVATIPGTAAGSSNSASGGSGSRSKAALPRGRLRGLFVSPTGKGHASIRESTTGRVISFHVKALEKSAPLGSLPRNAPLSFDFDPARGPYAMRVRIEAS